MNLSDTLKRIYGVRDKLDNLYYSTPKGDYVTESEMSDPEYAPCVNIWTEGKNGQLGPVDWGSLEKPNRELKHLTVDLSTEQFYYDDKPVDVKKHVSRPFLRWLWKQEFQVWEELEFNITSAPIKAQSRNLKIKWSKAAARDLMDLNPDVLLRRLSGLRR